jgi:hypothetical protein
MNGRLNRCEPLEENRKLYGIELFGSLAIRFWAPRKAPREQVCDFNYFKYYFSAAGTQRNPIMTVGW